MMPQRGLFDACHSQHSGTSRRFLVRTVSLNPDSARDRLGEDCCPLWAPLQGWEVSKAACTSIAPFSHSVPRAGTINRTYHC